MRWLVGILFLSGCAGDGGPTPDVVFDVKITNTEADCGKQLDEGGLTKAGMKDALEAIWPLNLGSVPTDFCPCTDVGATGTTDCYADIGRSKETLSYELHQDGDAISIRIDGETFATGTLRGCSLDYESPVWLDTTDNGEVQWQVKSVVTVLDMNGACKTAFKGDSAGNDFLGIEEVEVVGSSNDNYPVGRKVWKIVAGTRQGG